MSFTTWILELGHVATTELNHLIERGCYKHLAPTEPNNRRDLCVDNALTHYQ